MLSTTLSIPPLVTLNVVIILVVLCFCIVLVNIWILFIYFVLIFSSINVILFYI